MRTRAAILWLTVAFGVSAGERPGDWTGHYYACDGHAELSKPGHMNLSVRFATSKARVATAFAQAMSFLADVLDMEWHTENGREIAIQAKLEPAVIPVPTATLVIGSEMWADHDSHVRKSAAKSRSARHASTARKTHR